LTEQILAERAESISPVPTPPYPPPERGHVGSAAAVVVLANIVGFILLMVLALTIFGGLS
jgi:hypothetical protein